MLFPTSLGGKYADPMLRISWCWYAALVPEIEHLAGGVSGHVGHLRY